MKIEIVGGDWSSLFPVCQSSELLADEPRSMPLPFANLRRSYDNHVDQRGRTITTSRAIRKSKYPF